MQTIPSLTCTYIQAFHLYRRSFIPALPFLLLLVFSQYGLNHFLVVEPGMHGNLILKSIIDIVISALFFSLLTSVIYESSNQASHLYSRIYLALKRAFQVCIAYLILSLPLLFIMNATFIDNRTLFLSILGGGLLLTLLLYTFSFIAGVYIVIQGSNAFLGLRKSWYTIRSCWLDTLLLIIVLGMMTISFSMLSENLDSLSTYLTTLIFSSFYPSLMIVRYNQLTRTS